MIRVPIVEAIKSDSGEPIFVKIDRLKAIEFLKKDHELLTHTELERELHDASRDFSRVIQRES